MIRTRTNRFVAVALLVGLALRLLAFWFVQETPPAGDEVEYGYRAQALVDGREVAGGKKRPPGSIWYYAAFLRLTGADARIANVVAGCAAIWLVWLLGHRFCGPRVAALAAVGTAVYPGFLFYSSSLWSESLYSALALGALVLLVPDGARVRAPALLGAGALMGAAALTREVGIFLPVVGALWLLGCGGVTRLPAWRRVALLCISFAVVLLPWTIRQNAGSDAFTLVSQTSWLNLYVGNGPPPEGSGPDARRAGNAAMYRAYQKLGADRAEREAAAKEIAVRAIRDRMPWWPFEKVVETLPALLTPVSLPVSRLINRPDGKRWALHWAYRTPVDGTRWIGLRTWIAYVAVAAWAVVLVAGTAGLALAWGRAWVPLFLAVVAFLVFPIVLTFGASRFRLPFVPLLLIAASWLVVHGAGAWAEAGPRKRVSVVLVALLVALTAASEWRELIDPGWS